MSAPAVSRRMTAGADREGRYVTGAPAGGGGAQSAFSSPREQQFVIVPPATKVAISPGSSGPPGRGRERTGALPRPRSPPRSRRGAQVQAVLQQPVGDIHRRPRDAPQRHPKGKPWLWQAVAPQQVGAAASSTAAASGPSPARAPEAQRSVVSDAPPSEAAHMRATRPARAARSAEGRTLLGRRRHARTASRRTAADAEGRLAGGTAGACRTAADRTLRPRCRGASQRIAAGLGRPAADRTGRQHSPRRLARAALSAARRNRDPAPAPCTGSQHQRAPRGDRPRPHRPSAPAPLPPGGRNAER